MKISDRTKIDIIIVLVGIIVIGFLTFRQYQYVTECSRILGKPTYDKKTCDWVLYGKKDKKEEWEDWEQYKRDMKDAKFRHDLYEEADRLRREGR